MRAKIARRLAVKRTAEESGHAPLHVRLPVKAWGKLHTEFKKRLFKLKAKKAERLASAVETLPDSFSLWDRKGRLVTCNARFREFYGLEGADIRPGMKRDAIMKMAIQPVRKSVIVKPTQEPAQDQDASPANDAPANSSLPESKDAHKEDRCFEVLMSDGRWLHISENTTEDGGLVSVGADITILKKSAEKIIENEQKLRVSVSDLRKSRRELERQKQILVELSEKYAKEKNRAEAANRSKSEFLANISHELRTPLNAVIGFSEIMQHGLFGKMSAEKYSEYSRDINESGHFLLEVINDILDMSRIEAGRVDLHVESGDLCELFDECLRLVSGAANDKNIAICYKGPDRLLHPVDRRAFKQVVLNLLSNAVKFTPENGQVTITARQDSDAINVTIEDTGIGIPAEKIDRLGRPFEQVENQFTKSHKGTGLGLAISRSLVELHGGELYIRSQLNLGTRVTCRFPIEKSEDSNDKSAFPRQNAA